MGCFGCFSVPNAEVEERRQDAGGKESTSAQDGTDTPFSKRQAEKEKEGLLVSLLSACEAGKSLRDLACALEASKSSLKKPSIGGDRTRKRVGVLLKCIDTAWRILLDALEGNRAGGGLDWTTTTIKGIQEHLWKSIPDADMKDISYITCLALGGVRYYFDRMGEEGLPLGDQGVFHSTSINAFMNYVAIVLNRSVTQLSFHSLHKNRLQFGEILQLLGLGGNWTCVLTADSLSTLVYLLHNTDYDERKLSVRVHRNQAFDTSFEDFMLHNEVRESRCKVFPVFFDDSCSGGGGFEGQGFEKGEGHGPRKEFFDLVARELATKNGTMPSLFTYSRSMGKFWFNLGLMKKEEHIEKYYFAGWLLAQCVFNRTKMCIDFADPIFSRLVDRDDFCPTMAYLEEVDPEAAKSIRNIEKLPQGDFESMLGLEGKNVKMSRKDFMHESIQTVLLNGVRWQFDALCKGFHSVIDSEPLKEYFNNPNGLRWAICGPSVTEQAGFSVREVFLVNNDEELEDQWSQLSEALWDVVDDWPTEQKLQFVKFVTGSDRLPLPRTEMIKVELPFFAFSDRDHEKLLRTLPQAHTCENLLELPNYWESLLQVRGSAMRDESLRQEVREILAKNLAFAIANCDSYGLDTLTPEGEAFNEVSSHLNPIGMSSKFGGDTDVSPVSEMKPAIRVTNDEIEFLSVYQHDEDDLLALSFPETADATLRGKPSPLGQNGEGSGEGQKTVYDTSIDDLVDDLGIEGM